jgi:hypothetical protein
MDNSNSTVVLAQSVMGMFDAISLIASIASLILAVLAIWLTLAFKRDSDKVNRETSDLLIEIKSESKAITEGVMAELKAYGETMRGNFTQNQATNNSFSSPTASYNIRAIGCADEGGASYRIYIFCLTQRPKGRISF